MKALQLISNAFLITLLTATVANADVQKTAYAHFERAINEVGDGKKAKEDLQKEMDLRKAKLENMHKDLEAYKVKAQKELEAKKAQAQKELTALQEAAQKQSAVMSQEARKAKEAEFNTKAMAFQKELESKAADFQKEGTKKELALRKEYETVEQDFAKRQAEVMAPIMQKMRTIAAAISSEGNYDAIGDLGKMIYVKPELDVTNELIRRYNASNPAKTAKK